MPTLSLETVAVPCKRGLPRVCAGGWALWLVAAATAAVKMPSPAEVAAVFKPFRTDQAALSPDGQYLAYTVREGPILFLAMTPVDRPQEKERITIGQDDVSGFFQRRVNASVRVNWLHWSTSNRLVYAVTVPEPSRRIIREEVRVVNPDGKNDHKLVDAEDFDQSRSSTGRRNAGAEPVPRRPRVLNFCPDDPEAVLVEAVGGRGLATGVFKVNFVTGQFKSLYEEDDEGRYLYDVNGHARVLEPPALAFPTRMPPMGGRGGGGGGGGGRGGGGMRFPPEEPRLVEQDFSYRPAEGRHSWQELDSYLGKGSAFGFRLTVENFYGHRSFPVAVGADPEVLYFASNVGRDTYGLYGLDPRTKQRTEFAVELPDYDLVDPGDALAGGGLVFDRQRHLMGVRLPGPRLSTRWIDGALGGIQRTLDGKFTGRGVEILDWDDAHHRVLILVSSLADPGRYFVYDDGPQERLTEWVRRAPGLPPDALNVTTPFAFDTPAGVHVTGLLTVPHVARTNPPPLVLFCRDLPGRRERAAFSRDAQALADMGLVVAQVNYRGSAGMGAKERDAIRDGYDRVPIEDLRAAVAWVAGQHQINPRRVALLGEGYGGYLAMRALQLYPNEFRCAIGINAPSDPARWVDEPPLVNGRSLVSFDFAVRGTFFDHRKLKGLAIADHVEATAKPVFIIQDPDLRSLWSSQGTNVRDAMKKRGLDVEYLEIEGDFARSDSEARATAFAKIAGFVNDHVYDYGVDIGETREVK
jgi:dienelactone hydrolase